jgi:hypothetical protein
LIDGQIPDFADHPVASAFVTSFDLELELALLARRRRFAMVMPVHTLRPGADEHDANASLCWLGCVVEPPDGVLVEEQIERVLRPRQWFTLQERETDLLVADLPTVVRLNGCPLVELPVLDDPDHVEIRNHLTKMQLLDDSEELVLHHALVIDEYTALLHSTADVYLGPDGEDRWGLPPDLVMLPNADGEWERAGNARYWALFGVQVGDHGVRHRLATHLAAPQMTDAKSRRANVPARSGMAVTRRIGNAEKELLHWYGFDIAIDDCGDFRDDLEDYAKHLERGIPLSSRACAVRGR